jgi:hypothetical protein
MKARVLFPVLLSLAIFAVPSLATAQPKAEVGGSLASLMIGLGDNNETVFGIPSATFGLSSPGVYASFFTNPHFAIEPQLGLIVASSGGHSSHVLSAAAQVDYFLNGLTESSLYGLAAAGVLDVSSSSSSPKSLSFGGGYRMPVGGRLVFRVDGRFSHFTDGGGEALSFAFSIGGLFDR